VGSEVRYMTVRLGLVSSDRETERQDKPTISLLIRSFLPTVSVIQHYFALPIQRYVAALSCLWQKHHGGVWFRGSGG